MIYKLTNTHLSATFSAKGAELQSLKDCDQLEYIWQANPTYWGRHTPILFPLVGKVLDNTYTHNGATYTLGQHGFARDFTFKVTDQSPTTLTFLLESSGDTLKLFPFNFQLYVIYTLEEKTLHITYQVKNLSTETMGFKIGAHPGFNCPLFQDEVMEDYAFHFEQEETATLMPLVLPGYFTHEEKTFNGKTIPLSPDCFKEDAIVLKNLRSTSVSLRSKNHSKGIRVDFSDFPYLGLWSPSTPSPFVCIEPWMAHADYVDDAMALMEKRDLLTLQADEQCSCTHSLTVLG